MILTGETVYTANVKTNSVDKWACFGETPTAYKGDAETLCFLRRGQKIVTLPKRCVFLSEEAALAALSK